MTEELKHYSKRREAVLRRLVDDAITDLRIKTLKGEIRNCIAQEEFIYKHLNGLADAVVNKFKEKL